MRPLSRLAVNGVLSAAMREGLLPHTVTTVLRLATTPARAKALTELIGEMLDPTETAVAAFEQDDGQDRGVADPPWFVEIYFAEDPDREAILDLVGPVLGADVGSAVFSDVAARDWVAASLEGLKPVRAGRFLVHGGHDRHLRRPGDIAIEIEAGLAFGTGHHGTTAGCLMAIDAHLKKCRPARIIDVGAGTGVLALAAALRLRRPVIAGDIDPIAVEVMAENAALNGARGLIKGYVGPGVRHAIARRTRHFDLVIANILQRPLMRLARELAEVTAPGGRLVLSGLLVKDANGVIFAYGAQGFRLVSRGVRDGWVTLVLARRGASPAPR
jgi:ribosomal protein L11 methyltransferase